MNIQDRDVAAVDANVNLMTPEVLRHRPSDRREFFLNKIGVDERTYAGISLEQMLGRMDSACIEKAFSSLRSPDRRGIGPPITFPATQWRTRYGSTRTGSVGLAGIDPTQGMAGVRDLQQNVEELGFIGAHIYPHWFELPPDHARYYPFYAKCVELGIHVQLQVGQSLIYSKDTPKRSVGRPIALDAVACDFPELKVIGIHIGIPGPRK